MDIQDKKDGTKQEPAKTQEIKPVDDTAQDASYKAEAKDAK